MLIVGSEALRLHVPTRAARDIDIVAYRADLAAIRAAFGDHPITDNNAGDLSVMRRPGERTVEILWADDKPALRMLLDAEDARHAATPRIASPAALLSLKKGHIFQTTSTKRFWKHAADYVALGRLVDASNACPEITRQHSVDTVERLARPYRLPSLETSPQQFFGQSEAKVPTWFVHDDIHEAMAHRERAMYTYMQLDPENSVRCERSLWDQFTHDHKIQCVLEESYVIALERRLIPHWFGAGRPWTPEAALRWSMFRVCTTLTSGWFRQFALDHALDVWSARNPRYAETFLDVLDAGRIAFKPESLPEDSVV